jgi:hypothetical protein
MPQIKEYLVLKQQCRLIKFQIPHWLTRYFKIWEVFHDIITVFYKIWFFFFGTSGLTHLKQSNKLLYTYESITKSTSRANYKLSPKIPQLRPVFAVIATNNRIGRGTVRLVRARHSAGGSRDSRWLLLLLPLEVRCAARRGAGTERVS